jgi:hypothetical protein
MTIYPNDFKAKVRRLKELGLQANEWVILGDYSGR